MKDQNASRTLGWRLRLARRRRGLTQKAAAEALGVTDATIGMYEADKRRPDPDGLAALARLYGVSADWLLGLTADEPGNQGSQGQAIAAHANEPPGGVDLAEWERQARERLEQLIQDMRRDWERRQRRRGYR